jgi:hypothetical protein
MDPAVTEIMLEAPALAEMSREDEQRREHRKLIRLRADVRLPDNSVLEGHTVDLSRRGVGILSPVQLTNGQNCTISLDLTACGENVALRLVGRVCYCMESGNEYRIGLQFVQMDESTALLISELLK